MEMNYTGAKSELHQQHSKEKTKIFQNYKVSVVIDSLSLSN